MPIGEVTRYLDTDAGIGLEGRFYDTERGQEAYKLTKAGKYNSLSAGFFPTQVRTEDDVTVWERAHLNEVSLVKRGAYPSAKVSQVRSGDNNTNASNSNKEVSQEETRTIMENEVTKYDDSEIRSRIDNVEHELAVVLDGAGTQTHGSQFRSLADMVKGLYGSKHDAAAAEIRAYTGGTLADNDGATRPAWLNSTLQIVQQKREITDAFTKIALPASGMSMDVPVVTDTTGEVAIVGEGEDMPYGEASAGTQSFPIKKFGGYTSLTAEEIERTEVGMLDLNLRWLVERYARATEAYALNALTSAAGVNTVTLGANTAAGWVDGILEATDAIYDNSPFSATADFVIVSRDVYRELATLVDSTGRPLFVLNGDGANTFGGMNIRSVSGNIAGLPLVVGSKLPAGSIYVTGADALFTAEEPLKSLSDVNVINATKDFSVYGFFAAGVRNAKGITKVSLV